MKLNIQFFATQVTTMDSAGNDLSPEMQVYYEKRLLDAAEPKLVHDQFGDKYPIPAGGGKSIRLRRYTPLTKATTALTEGVTPQGRSLDVTTVNATVGQYGDYIQMSDMLLMTAIDNNVTQATKLLGAQAGRTLDTITRDVLVGGTNVLYAPKTVNGVKTDVEDRDELDATATLTPELFFRAAAILQSQNAETIDDSYVAIIHPYAAYDLMRSQEWIDKTRYGDSEHYYNGEIGKIGNVRFVVSTEAKIWKDTTCPADGDDGHLAVFATLVLGAHAYGVTEVENGGLTHIVKQLGYGDDPLNQRASCGWKATRAAERLVEQYMVRIESCCSYSGTVNAN